MSSDDSGEGNSTIQIYCRVRPLKGNTTIANGRYWSRNPEVVDPNDPDAVPKIGFFIPKDQSAGMVNNQRENYDFKFDRVFDMATKQEEVFDIVAKPVVDNVLDGYNGTIFAYGQTGSGKTFTITGGAEHYGDRGIIPRAIQYIFKKKKESGDKQYDVAVSYLEIYNEIGYDLLDNSRDAKKLEDLPRVSLQEDAEELIHLRNLGCIPVSSEEDALNLLFVGDTNRMIAETPSNPSSSRSHCIFIISVTSRSTSSDVVRRSKLHLVDLAGSERVARTGIGGTLLKEAKYINLSLHYLEQVIVALHEKSIGKRSHIPYRNSMMTSVLRDSLGGNCKTTMIATCAVEDPLIDESISTCRFAQRVALIANNAVLNEETDPYMTIARLQREIARLRTELAIARGDGMNNDEELPEYEIERVKQAVEDYIADLSKTASLDFSDFRKIQCAYGILKTLALKGNQGGSNEMRQPLPQTDTCSGLPTVGSNVDIMKLKSLIEHRDNEIRILVGMINQLKAQIQVGKTLGNSHISSPSMTDLSSETLETKSQQHPVRVGRSTEQHHQTQLPSKDVNASLASLSTLKKGIPKLTTEKAKAFEIFKNGYPSGPWIDGQKQLLKTKYTEAKALGENAQRIRNEIKHTKEQMSSEEFCDQDRQDLRSEVAEKARLYKNSYEQLKELKSEIEHLQYLLEHARHRLTRDFEHWYINVYMDSEQEERTLDQVSEQISQDDFSQVSTVPVSGARAAMQAMRDSRASSRNRELPNAVQSSMSSSTLIDSPRSSTNIPSSVTKAPSLKGIQGSGTSVQDDIMAFYKAREQITTSGRSTPVVSRNESNKHK